jgi:hypothetical protein
MRKIILLMLSIVFCIASAQAQKLKEGSLDFLKGETKLNISFDYTELKVDGKAEKEFVEHNVERMNIEEPESGDIWKAEWDNSFRIKIFHPGFIKETNRELFDNDRKLRIGTFDDANYQAIVKVFEIIPGKNAGPFSDDPNVNVEVVFTKIDNNEVLAKILIKKSLGKPFSNFEGRIGSAYENVGENFGKFLAKKLK